MKEMNIIIKFVNNYKIKRFFNKINKFIKEYENSENKSRIKNILFGDDIEFIYYFDDVKYSINEFRFNKKLRLKIFNYNSMFFELEIFSGDKYPTKDRYQLKINDDVKTKFYDTGNNYRYKYYSLNINDLDNKIVIDVIYGSLCNLEGTGVIDTMIERKLVDYRTKYILTTL